MVAVLSGRYRHHVAYSCQSCQWSGLVALSGVTLTNAEVWQLFSCPTHGAQQTNIKTIDTDLLECRRKR